MAILRFFLSARNPQGAVLRSLGKRSFALLLLAFFLITPSAARAQNSIYDAVSTPRFTLYFGNNDSSSLPRNIRRETIAAETLEILGSTTAEVNRIFETDPEQKVVLRFLSSAQFQRQTGAPSWTSAMYYRGEITVPLSSRGLNVEELRRTLRHEYVHAVTAELSAQRCPAWLDEGLAQLIEGKPNSLLGPALRNWVRQNGNLSFDSLQNGFMSLEDSLVPVAYAHSLFAARSLVNTSGFGAIRDYLNYLNRGLDEGTAFTEAFGKTLLDFQEELNQQLALWVQTDQVDP